MKRFVIVAALLAACSHGAQPTPNEPTGAPHEGTRADLGAAPTAKAGTAGPDQSAITPAAPPSKVKIMVRTNPPKVFVYWGKKKLGLTPYNLERPRDSGPVDLVLKAQGFIPFHTRAYTVKNDLIGVKMVKVQDKMTIYGAKQEIPPENVPLDPLDPANAAKPPASGAPASTTAPPSSSTATAPSP